MTTFRREGCQWIAGDPQIDPSKCGKPVSPGSPYCQPHHELCHEPLKGAPLKAIPAWGK